MTAAMGAQAAKQFDRFQQIRFADSVRADHQQPRLAQSQLELLMVPEPSELELVKPDGIRCDVWVRYPYRDGLRPSLLLRSSTDQWACSSVG